MRAPLSKRRRRASRELRSVSASPGFRPSAFVRRWILVESHRAKGQKPVSESPLSADCVVVRADDAGVDHLHRVGQGPALDQRLRDKISNLRPRPEQELPIAMSPLTSPRRLNAQPSMGAPRLMRGVGSARSCRNGRGGLRLGQATRASVKPETAASTPRLRRLAVHLHDGSLEPEPPKLLAIRHGDCSRDLANRGYTEVTIHTCQPLAALNRPYTEFFLNLLDVLVDYWLGTSTSESPTFPPQCKAHLKCL